VTPSGYAIGGVTYILHHHQKGKMEYGFFSRTTIDFTIIRIRRDGLKSAIKDLWIDFRHSIIRGHKMWDYRKMQ
jgi:hypothetical protein